MGSLHGFGGQREGNCEQVVAYAVAADGAGPTAGEVRAFVTGVLPEFMVPTRLAVVPRLPTTANGKIDVAPLLAAQAADAAAIAPGDGYAVEAVHRVWQLILGASSADIDSNWFDLGGSSLTLIAVQEELQRQLEREIPLLLLFSHTTIRSLAAALAGETGGQQRTRRTSDRQRRVDARRRRVEARRAFS